MGLWFALICWVLVLVGLLAGLFGFMVVCCCGLWVCWLTYGGFWRGCCVAWVCGFCLLLIGIRAIGLVVLSGCWCAGCCLTWWCWDVAVDAGWVWVWVVLVVGLLVLTRFCV